MVPPIPAEDPQRVAQRLRWQRNALMLVVWVVGALFLVVVREVLLPFAVAILLAYVLHPSVTALARLGVGGRHIPRWVATLMLYAVMGVTMWGLGRAFIPQVSAELRAAAVTARDAFKGLDQDVAGLPEDLNALAVKFGIPVVFRWSDPNVKAPPVVDDADGFEVDLRAEFESLTVRAQSAALAMATALAAQAQGVATGLLGFIFKVFLVLMLTAFLLSDVALIRRTALELVPVERRPGFDALLDRMDTGLAGVVRGQLTICGVNGVLTLAGMLLFNVKFAFLLSLVAGVFSLIPIFGSIASSVPIVAIALTDGLQKGVLALAWIVGIHALEANLFNPKIMGSAAKIHPLMVVLVLVAGEHFFGFTGALFAVPVLSIVLTVLKNVLARAQRVQNLLDQPLPPPPLGVPADPSRAPEHP
jgi:predicted PurR-regulated permease PerM